MDTVDCLKLGATALAGIFAGEALYINAVDHPSRMANLDTKSNRLVWAQSYKTAKKLQGGMCILGSLAGAGAYYMDQDSAHKYLWLVGSGVFLTVWPYTLLVMMSDIKKNIHPDAINAQGEKWVLDHIVRWNKQHMYRTAVSFAAFGIFLYALSKK